MMSGLPRKGGNRTEEKMKTNSEFEKFDHTMRDLMSVPHDEIKAALDKEKAAKKRKKKTNATVLAEAEQQ
jgi:hypothetical protein